MRFNRRPRKHIVYKKREAVFWIPLNSPHGANPGSTEGEGGLSYHERGADSVFSERIDFLLTPGNENGPEFSPDGRYLAYNSDETERFEVYVQPFPEGSRKVQVSMNGGNQPRWSADGAELFYVDISTNMLMAVPISTEPTFTVGELQALFASGNLPQTSVTNFWRYDVFPDGQRFVMLAPVESDDDAAPTTIPHRPELVRRVPRSRARLAVRIDITIGVRRVASYKSESRK